MKILFDNQIFKAQKYGGISRYFCELFKHINVTNDVQYHMPIRDTNNEYLKNIYPLSEKKIYKNIPACKNSKVCRKLINIIELFDKNSNINLSKEALIKNDFDIFHPTYYSKYFLKYIKNKPFVLTVYDMIHELYPEYFNLDKITARNKKILIQKANHIIAISENTKKDIMNLYGIDEKKIKVIYLGNSIVSSTKIPRNTPQIPQKYILFVGSRGLYKNFTLFIESISEILRSDKSINVIVAGGYSNQNNFSKEEVGLFEMLNIENQIFQYSVNDEQLAHLYQNALCFVFPSLYEGFGIPILEAFSCNCPAVVSNTSSLPEVGGNAAIYFDPKDKRDIYDKVNEVIYNEKVREQMIKRGREQLKNFSWEKTAKETIELYREILK